MRIFMTGASGFIGSAVVRELIDAGYGITGLARSDDSAHIIEGLGARAHRGNLEDLPGVTDAVAKADAVIHLGAVHDWTNMERAFRIEQAAVRAIGEALAGSNRPFVLASGVAFSPGHSVSELDRIPDRGDSTPRGGSETLALDYADKQVQVVVVRFAPTVHGAGDHGFIHTVARAAQQRGSSDYAGDGANRWPAVHRSDAARLVRLGLENAPGGSVLHAVAEEGVAVRDIAEALACRLGVSAKSVPAEHLAEDIPFIGAYMVGDFPATSTRTQQLLKWKPRGPTLLEDIAAGHYDT